MSAKPRRRWFRFGLRTLFVVLTVFGVWLAVQVKYLQDRSAALAMLEARDPGFRKGEYFGFEVHFREMPLMLRVFGVQREYFIRVNNLTLEEGQRIDRLFPEAIAWRDATPPTH